MTVADGQSLQPGSLVYWHDPDEGRCSRWLTVRTINVRDDGVTRITAVDNDELECYITELEYGYRTWTPQAADVPCRNGRARGGSPSYRVGERVRGRRAQAAPPVSADRQAQAGRTGRQESKRE